MINRNPLDANEVDQVVLIMRTTWGSISALADGKTDQDKREAHEWMKRLVGASLDHLRPEKANEPARD